MSDEKSRAEDQWRLLRIGEITPEAFRAFLAQHGLTPESIGVDPKEVDYEAAQFDKYVRV